MTMNLAGRVADCVLLSYRTPAQSVAHLLPPGVELVTRGPWAFWNVMACRVEDLRPMGVPRWCGITYHHVAYRLLVRAMTREADVLRGLYFVRSDADRAALNVLANRLTDLRLHDADIELLADEASYCLRVSDTERAAGDAEIDLAMDRPTLAAGSCFPTLKDAQEFLRYPPLALAGDGGSDRLRLTRVHRDDAQWRERPVTVRRARVAFLETLGQHDATLELATRVEPIEYRWELGRTAQAIAGGLQHEHLPRRPAAVDATAATDAGVVP